MPTDFQPEPAPLELAAGTLAFYDSLTAGLLPCKVVTIDRYNRGANSSPSVRVLVRVTAKRRHGELIDSDARLVMPRAAVHRVRGSYGQRIRVAPFRVVVTREC